VTYLPDGGGGRRIKAVVTRSQAEAMGDLSGGSRPVFEVLVENNSTSGIASSEINTGGDKIELGLRVENRPKKLRLCEVLNHDAGMMLLAAW